MSIDYQESIKKLREVENRLSRVKAMGKKIISELSPALKVILGDWRVELINKSEVSQINLKLLDTEVALVLRPVRISSDRALGAIDAASLSGRGPSVFKFSLYFDGDGTLFVREGSGFQCVDDFFGEEETKSWAAANLRNKPNGKSKLAYLIVSNLMIEIIGVYEGLDDPLPDMKLSHDN